MKIFFQKTWLIFLAVSYSSTFAQKPIILKDTIGFKNRIFANVGTSFYYYHYLKGQVNATQPIEASLEFGIHKNVTMGISYATQTRQYQFIDSTYYIPPKAFSYWYHYQAFRIRVVSYLNDFLNDKLSLHLNTEKIKLYASYMVGITHTEDTRSWEPWEKVNASGVPFYYDITYHFGFTLGVRTNPVNFIGFFAEVGPSEIGLVKAGVSIDIK